MLLYSLHDLLFGGLLIPVFIHGGQNGDAVPHWESQGDEGVYKGVYVLFLVDIRGEGGGGAVSGAGETGEDDAPAGELVPPGYFTVGVQNVLQLGPVIAALVAYGLQNGCAVGKAPLPGEIAADNVLLRPLVKGVLQNAEMRWRIWVSRASRSPSLGEGSR